MPSSSERFGLLPPGYRRAVQRMVEDYAGVFGGRDAELVELDRFLEQDEQPYAFLLAPTGRGKTALLLHWLQHLDEHDNLEMIVIPISRRYQTASARVTLNALAEALASFFSELIQPAAMSPDQLRPLIADFLRRPVESGRNLLLVLDGLDEAVGWAPGSDLFPPTLGAGIRVVASARQLAHRGLSEWLDVLGWSADRTTALSLSPLSEEALRQLLEALSKPLAELLTQPAIIAELLRLSQGDPLTLRLLIEGLRDETLSSVQLASQMPGVDVQMQTWLADLQHVDTPAIELFLGLCATAHGPLRAEDMCQLGCEVFPDRHDVHRAANAVGRFVIGGGTAEAGYVFSHPRLREVYLEQLLTDETRVALRERFVAWGERVYEARSTRLADYLRQFWMTHLVEAERWELARAVLTHIEEAGGGYQQYWAAARSTVEGSASGYLADLDVLWQYADESHDLGRSLRCALIASSIRSSSAHLTAELLAGLLTVGTSEGHWHVSAVLEHIRQMPQSGHSSPFSVLRDLLMLGTPLPYEHVLDIIQMRFTGQERAELLMRIVHAFPSGEQRALAIDAFTSDYLFLRYFEHPTAAIELLLDVETALPPRRVLDVLVLLAETLDHDATVRPMAAPDDARAQALALLVSRRPALCAEVLVATKTYSDWGRGRIATALVRWADRALLEPVLTLILQLREEGALVEGIGKLAPLLSQEQGALIFQQICALPTLEHRAGGSAALAPCLPPALHAAALDVIAWQEEPQRWAWVVKAFAPHLALDLLRICLERALALEDVHARGMLLTDLGEALAHVSEDDAARARSALAESWSRRRLRLALAAKREPEERAQIYLHVLEEALAQEGAIAIYLLQLMLPSDPMSLPEHVRRRIWELALPTFGVLRHPEPIRTLMHYPPPGNDPQLYAELIRAVCASDGQFASTALRMMIPDLPRTVHPDLLTALRDLPEPGYRSHLLAILAPYLDPELIPLAVEIARALVTSAEPGRAVSALTALAKHGPVGLRPSLYAEALAAARVIADIQERADFLRALVPVCSSEIQADVRTRALDAARQLVDGWQRMKALRLLAPLRPEHEQEEHREEVCASWRSIPYVWQRIDVGPDLLSDLPPPARDMVCREIMSALAAEPGAEERVSYTLPRLAAYLPGDLLSQALGLAQAIDDLRVRIETLAIVIPLLPHPAQEHVYQATLQTVLAYQPGSHPAEAWKRAEALEALVPITPPELLLEVCREALTAATILHAGAQATLLQTVAHYAPADLIPQALTVGRAIPLREIHARVDGLAAFLPRLAPEDQHALCEELLNTLSQARRWERIGSAFARLVPKLPETLIMRAWELGRALAPDEYQADALVAVALRLPDDLRPQGIAEALESIQHHVFVDRLPSLIPRATQIEGALTTQLRLRLLAKLAPYLTWEDQTNLYSSLLTSRLALDPHNNHQLFELLVPLLLAHVEAEGADQAPIIAAWKTSLRRVAGLGRPVLLKSLTALMPWLARVMPAEVLDNLSSTLDNVVSCWP